MDRSFYEELVQKARAEGIVRYVVGAVVPKENDEDVLLLKRKPEDFMGGIYELPGGEVDEGETIEAAVFRETMEETGLKGKNIRAYLGHFDYLSGSGKPTRQFNFIVTIDPPFTITLQEHSDHAWVRRETTAQYQVTDSVKQVLESFWRRDFQQ